MHVGRICLGVEPVSYMALWLWHGMTVGRGMSESWNFVHRDELVVSLARAIFPAVTPPRRDVPSPSDLQMGSLQYDGRCYVSSSLAEDSLLVECRSLARRNSLHDSIMEVGRGELGAEGAGGRNFGGQGRNREIPSSNIPDIAGVCVWAV